MLLFGGGGGERTKSGGRVNIGKLPSSTLPRSRSCGGAVPWQCCKEDDDEMVIVITTRSRRCTVQSSLIHQNQWAHKLPIFDTSLDAHQTIHSVASNTAHPHHMATHHYRGDKHPRERERDKNETCVRQ
mmetsp:Transcript_10376/g.15612  ORF Transcript_10376/g.15612 Transcript_10376/m.15612 type:complete len:129 (+) Transcript_10376:54-440(+)